MSLFVVDASAGIKWFVPEVHGSEAMRLRDPGHALHVPTLFDVEVANVVWKKVRNGELTRDEGDEIVAELALLPVQRHAELPLLGAAFDIANRAQRTVYDSLYVALAAQLGGQVVTADQRLINSLAGTPWAAHVVWIGNIA